MQKPALCRALAQNLAVLQDRFGGSDDFYTKKLSVGGIRCAIIMFTGISSPEKLCLNKALSLPSRSQPRI